MTKVEQEIFFALLRSAVWEKPMEIECLEGKEFSWLEILQGFADHALLGVVANAVIRLPEEYRPDEQLQQEILQFCEDLQGMHCKLNQALVDSFCCLEGAGCNPILLKGQGLATFYPSSCIRSCGDIDIYVGEGDFEKACLAINNYCGVIAALDDIYEDGLHYHVALGEVVFEIHRKAAYAYGKSKQSAFDSFTREFLRKEISDNVLIKDKLISVPSIRYNIIYLFIHMSKHIIKAEDCLRQMIDLVYVLSSSGLDYNLFKKDLESFGLIDSWKKIESFLISFLGLPNLDGSDKFDSAEKNQEIADLVISSSICNSDAKTYKQMPLGIRRLYHSIKDYYKTRRLSFILFPHAAIMEMYRHYKVVVSNRI